MRAQVGSWRALTNGGFVLGVLALAGFGLTEVASRQWKVQRTFTVQADFATILGVETGSRVRVQGIDAGVVESIVPPTVPGQPVRLVFRVDEKLRRLVRSDAQARIVTEGVVGSKVVEIVPGKADAPPLRPSGMIGAEPSVELADLVRKAAVSLDRIDAVSLAAERGLGEANEIAAAIKKGDGSLGKLMKDDEAYRRLVGLSDKGERTLRDLEESLAALKRTWPLSRYFHDRAFFDRDRLLFQPGAERDSRTIGADELFEPGRSVLTARGRHKLDEVGYWFNRVRRPSSEVVIAAFTDDHRDADLAQILTQEQADSVRKYLISKYAIASSGWFGTRKVAAVGFGTESPRTLDTAAQGEPPRRVSIIVFTPQA
jgi:phospholipid/cholesterol/gamma-HCH transport system substrate-binding protein